MKGDDELVESAPQETPYITKVCNWCGAKAESGEELSHRPGCGTQPDHRYRVERKWPLIVLTFLVAAGIMVILHGV